MNPRSPLGSRQGVKKKANKTEQRLAKDLEGRAVPSSGALDGAKGDVETPEFLIDSKETGTRGITVSASMLNKISKEAREVQKRPALALKLEKVAIGTPKQWVCIPLADFQRFTEDD